MRNQGVLWILHIHGRLLRPGVAIEIAADHVAVFGPGVKTVRRTVRATKTLALADEIQQVGLLLIG